MCQCTELVTVTISQSLITTEKQSEFENMLMTWKCVNLFLVLKRKGVLRKVDHNSYG